MPNQWFHPLSHLPGSDQHFNRTKQFLSTQTFDTHCIGSSSLSDEELFALGIHFTSRLKLTGKKVLECPLEVIVGTGQLYSEVLFSFSREQVHCFPEPQDSWRTQLLWPCLVSLNPHSVLANASLTQVLWCCDHGCCHRLCKWKQTQGIAQNLMNEAFLFYNLFLLQEKMRLPRSTPRKWKDRTGKALPSEKSIKCAHQVPSRPTTHAVPQIYSLILQKWDRLLWEKQLTRQIAWGWKEDFCLCPWLTCAEREFQSQKQKQRAVA